MSLLERLKVGLAGSPPVPFDEVGRRVELEMDNGRLIRGSILLAGKGAAQLHIGTVQRSDGPGSYTRIAMVEYARVRRWRFPAAQSVDGNWMPEGPDYQDELLRSLDVWRPFRSARPN